MAFITLNLTIQRLLFTFIMSQLTFKTLLSPHVLCFFLRMLTFLVFEFFTQGVYTYHPCQILILEAALHFYNEPAHLQDSPHVGLHRWLWTSVRSNDHLNMGFAVTKSCFRLFWYNSSGYFECFVNGPRNDWDSCWGDIGDGPLHYGQVEKWGQKWSTLNNYFSTKI